MPRTQFATRYDLRTPGADAETRQEIYARAVQQAAYVDQHGQDALMRRVAASRCGCAGQRATSDRPVTRRKLRDALGPRFLAGVALSPDP